MRDQSRGWGAPSHNVLASFSPPVKWASPTFRERIEKRRPWPQTALGLHHPSTTQGKEIAWSVCLHLCCHGDGFLFCAPLGPVMHSGGAMPFWHAFFMAQMVKHLPTMQKTWVRSLGQEDPLVQRGLAPRSKGKARAELRPARRQSRLPHSRSLLLPGRER